MVRAYEERLEVAVCAYGGARSDPPAIKPLAPFALRRRLRVGAAAWPEILEPDLVNPLAQQRHGEAFAITGGDCLLLMA
jgi:hypothetical protein